MISSQTNPITLRKFSIALVGNPNCGKTTLFNALTGSQQRVGNWPGVTVEQKSGKFSYAAKEIEVIDLPGVYSLTISSLNSAIDESIACDFILNQRANLIINIVDASSLERHLYLTMQLLEMGTPMILVLNMMDAAKQKNISIDIEKLSQELNCPVIALEAHKKRGLEALKQAIVLFQPNGATRNYPEFSPALKSAIAKVGARLPVTESKPCWQAMRLLEGDEYVKNKVDPTIHSHVAEIQAQIQTEWNEDADILFADARYKSIEKILTKVQTVPSQPQSSWTSRIDAIVLNRVLGIPIFLSVMYLLFIFAINVGGAFQDFFDMSSQTIFVDGVLYTLNNLHAPTWLTVILAEGIGKGINTTITFIPVIGSMFLFLALLEDSGYMARAAFVIDRFMRFLGLPGKSFVPMIVGFGCNVPSVMGARTLENKRDRILTIMMSPFMSCGARLAIYAVFTAAFFPQGGQNIVFALYIIGIVMAILTGFLLRTTILKGEPAPLIMELPNYHLPQLKTLLLLAWQRLKSFVFRAGKLIIPICVLIGVLNSLTVDGTINTNDADSHSLLSLVGQWITPIFTPMGISADNWPATVGLVTGILAKEVVVGTLNTLYTQLGHLAANATPETFDLWGGLSAALASIPQNLAQLSHVFGNPVVAQAPIDQLSNSVYGLMYQKFDGKIGAFAYLLFILLYFPCISTMAAMLRELHKGWSIFSAIWMTGVAYGSAVVFYQAATLLRHPFSSIMWIMAVIMVFLLTIIAIRKFANREYRHVAINTVVGETS